MNRNELLNLLYLDRGATIVSVIYLSSGDVVDPMAKPKNRGLLHSLQHNDPDDDPEDLVGYARQMKASQLYHYRASPDLILAPRDMIVVPSRNGYALASVVQVHRTLPPDMKAGIALKWVAQKVDLRRLAELEKDEARVIETVRNAEVKTKLAEIEKGLGFNLDKIETPALMAPAPVTATE